MPQGKTIAAKNGATSGTVRPPTMLSRFVERLSAEAEVGATQFDGQAIAEQVAERILEAETLEDAISAQTAGMLSGKDMVNVPLLVTEYAVRTADPRYSEHGVGYYFVVDAINQDTGENVQFATGAMNVLLLIWKANNTGALPLECVIRSREVASGGDLLTLELTSRPVRSKK